MSTDAQSDTPQEVLEQGETKEKSIDSVLTTLSDVTEATNRRY